MTSVTVSLLLGFLFGVRHAFEPDHVAAVASLAVRSASLAERLRFATFWGVGHAGTLLLVAAAMSAGGLAVPAPLVRAFEVLVALMLVVLGVGVLLRLRRERVHFHVHRHGDGRRHFHAHAHRGESAHDGRYHEHRHPVCVRASLVGGIHGLAGSAALMLLASQSMRSGVLAIAYVACFGVGSICGMALFSLVIAVPLGVLSDALGPVVRTLEAALAAITIALGCWVALSVP